MLDRRRSGLNAPSGESQVQQPIRLVSSGFEPASMGMIAVQAFGFFADIHVQPHADSETCIHGRQRGSWKPVHAAHGTLSHPGEPALDGLWSRDAALLRHCSQQQPTGTTPDVSTTGLPHENMLSCARVACWPLLTRPENGWQK